MGDGGGCLRGGAAGSEERAGRGSDVQPGDGGSLQRRPPHGVGVGRRLGGGGLQHGARWLRQLRPRLARVEAGEPPGVRRLPPAPHRGHGLQLLPGAARLHDGRRGRVPVPRGTGAESPAVRGADRHLGDAGDRSAALAVLLLCPVQQVTLTFEMPVTAPPLWLSSCCVHPAAALTFGDAAAALTVIVLCPI